MISASLRFPLPPLTVLDRLFRKIKLIDQESFHADLCQVVRRAESVDDLWDLADLYKMELRILDKHAPVIKKRVVVRPKLP